MVFTLSAACASDRGLIRRNHEDNFFFDDRILEEDQRLRNPMSFEARLTEPVLVGVFDGIGGEACGDLAALAAAKKMKEIRKNAGKEKPEKNRDDAKAFLSSLCRQLNEAVLDQQQVLAVERMGTTMVSAFFADDRVYVCNVGDSRAYRLRNGQLTQLSADHVLRSCRHAYRKAPLIQYLGMDPEEIKLDPHIDSGELRCGDQYLLCSDGLTDMLSDRDILRIMTGSDSVQDCVLKLMDAAMHRGGYDNTTLIVGRIG